MRDVANRCRRTLAAAACVLCAIGSIRVEAQSTVGTLAGTVLDPEAKTIANAAVVVRSEVAGKSVAVTTDGTGRFTVDSLPVGLYIVEVTAPGFALARRSNLQVGVERPMEVSITLTIAGVTEEVTVTRELPEAAKTAPSQGSLTAASAQSLISRDFIQNYTSPVSDFSQVIQMAPGTFSVSPNGVGLGDTKTFFRGFKDGYYTISFDGIPFNDTNDPTHHSWAFFPSQTIGGTVFDRSPGTASTVGPTTYGGSVNLQSRSLSAQPGVFGSFSYGSFNTRLFDGEFDTGRFGPNGSSRLLLDVHQMESDGYQTYNYQKRDAFSAKYQYALSDRTTLTAFSSVIKVRSNTPNQKGSTRAQIAQFGDNFLMSGDASSPLYYGYNFYEIPTDFEYVGIRTSRANGWSFDDKAYTYRYYNKQNFNGTTTISTTSATDKLNSYRKVGNVLPISHVSELGVFRTGLWSEVAWTDRFQTPSDPRTWIDATLPNFHEQFTTTTLQPYVEYQFNAARNLRVTPGIKLAYYKQDFTQFADNGKTVGNLNGAPSIDHVAEYHSWLPSIDAHYLLRPNWSAYGQYGKGQTIPPSSVFDVKNAAVSVLPKPTLTDTVQFGTVWKADRFTLDADVYHIHFENDYSSSPDPATGEPVYYLAGSAVTQGIELESNILLVRGLGVYLNATKGSAKYVDTDLWVQNAPSDTETVGLSYNQGSWNVGFFNKRIGTMYNDNSGINQAVAIDPFNITNLFVNYTLKGSTRFAQSKIRLSVNNLLDKHDIVGVIPAAKTSNAPAPGDILNLMAARSVSLTFTVGFAPRQP